MQKIGITILSRSGEPVSTMAARFEQELDLQLAACEFGLVAAELDKRLHASDTLARSFGSLRVAAGGTMKRDVFAALFRQAAGELGLTTDVQGRFASSPRARSSIRPRSDDDGKPGEVRRFKSLGWGVKSLAFSPTGGWLAAGKSDRALLLFDVNAASQLDAAENLRGLSQLTSCLFTPDGSKLVAGGSSGQITMFPRRAV